MISLKKYLEGRSPDPIQEAAPVADGIFGAVVAAYRSALRTMGSSSIEACPIVGGELKLGLGMVDESLAGSMTDEKIERAERNVRSHLLEWGKRTARHYQQKADEVKEILMVMARTAESVSQRDARCASRLAEVTGRLQRIATLDDISEIRASIEASATELKTSIDRMTLEGKTAMDQLRTELSSYQTRLEEAEQIASSDSLTGLRSRHWMENYIGRRIEDERTFCLVIVDIDDFKRVNDNYGHPAGDELLQQFSSELKGSIRNGDVVCRWGGDEFLIFLDCPIVEGRSQTTRLKRWACGTYTLQARSGPVKVQIEASVGLAERKPRETLKSVLARADADMYDQKASARTGLRAAR
jgi:diguanylate cyclase (GGDEF)-like protein